MRAVIDIHLSVWVVMVCSGVKVRCVGVVGSLYGYKKAVSHLTFHSEEPQRNSTQRFSSIG